MGVILKLILTILAVSWVFMLMFFMAAGVIYYVCAIVLYLVKYVRRYFKRRWNR